MNKKALIKDLDEVYNLVSNHDIIEAMERLEYVISEVKQLHIPNVVKSLPTTEERDLELNEMLESYFSKNETQPIKDFKFGFKHCFKWIYDKINM